jgi:hypothetical protein
MLTHDNEHSPAFFFENTPTWESKAECSPRPLGHPSGYRKYSLICSRSLICSQWVSTQAMFFEVEAQLFNFG